MKTSELSKREIVIAGAASIILLAGVMFIPPKPAQVLAPASDEPSSDDTRLIQAVLPPEGVILPVRWGDLGVQMRGAGVIDTEKFEGLYASRGGLSDESKKLLYDSNDEPLKITEENSGVLLNLLWALGLGNKNDILENGPMTNPDYGGADKFASTGGWTLARGDVMEHYGKHQFVVLTKEQQELVERISKNIYRPCCNNPTYFPDCNHGMAMLGLLELMASQGIGEEEMYKTALAVNSYWFPGTYLTIAKYLESQNTTWDKANPKQVLGYDFSSASGYQNILNQVTPPEHRSGGGGCGA